MSDSHWFWWPWQFWGVRVWPFVEWASIGICLVFFSWLDWGYGFWWRRVQRSMWFSPYYIKGTYYQHDLWLLMLTLVMFAKFLHCEVTLLSPFYSVLFGRKSLCGAHTYGVGLLCSPSLKVQYLHKLFEILHWSFVSSPLFIYLFTHLFLSVRTQQYLFYTLSYNTVLLSLFYCSNCSSFDHWELFQLASRTFWHISIIAYSCVCVCVCVAHFYFLAL